MILAEILPMLPSEERDAALLRLHVCVDIATRQRGSVTQATHLYARKLGLSPSTIHRWYRKYVNEGSIALIDRRRIQHLMADH